MYSHIRQCQLEIVLFVTHFSTDIPMSSAWTRFGARMETTGAAKRPYRAMKAQQGSQNACW